MAPPNRTAGRSTGRIRRCSRRRRACTSWAGCGTCGAPSASTGSRRSGRGSTCGCSSRRGTGGQRARAPVALAGDQEGPADRPDGGGAGAEGGGTGRGRRPAGERTRCPQWCCRVWLGEGGELAYPAQRSAAVTLALRTARLLIDPLWEPIEAMVWSSRDAGLAGDGCTEHWSIDDVCFQEFWLVLLSNSYIEEGEHVYRLACRMPKTLQ